MNTNARLLEKHSYKNSLKYWPNLLILSETCHGVMAWNLISPSLPLKHYVGDKSNAEMFSRISHYLFFYMKHHRSIIALAGFQLNETEISIDK